MTAVAAPDDRVRHRIRVGGVVQGVGFRPFVHRLATELDLTGHVGNDSEGVFVEVEGLAPTVERFELRVVEEAPPLARIHRIEATAIEPVGDRGFRIERSRSAGSARTFVSPDIAVCDDVPGRDVRSTRPPSPLPVHQLHQLRSPIHHHHPASLRSPQHDHGRLLDV